MDELQACILNSKIKLFKNEVRLMKQAAIHKNCFAIKDIIFLPKIEKYNYSVYAQYTIIVKNRKK